MRTRFTSAAAVVLCCVPSGLTCLVELEELLFESISLGLLAVSPEPLHPDSAPAWSLRAHWRTLQGGKEEGREVLHYENLPSFLPQIKCCPTCFLVKSRDSMREEKVEEQESNTETLFQSRLYASDASNISDISEYNFTCDVAVGWPYHYIEIFLVHF